MWISWEWKELLKWNKKHFSSFLKGLYLDGDIPVLRFYNFVIKQHGNKKLYKKKKEKARVNI